MSSESTPADTWLAPDALATGVVVGAAIVRGGRLLAARRTAPPATAGRWELPGGKVEPGETPEAALVREIDEELGCTVVFSRWLVGEAVISPAVSLRVAVVTLAAGEPCPREHDRLSWLGAAEFDDVDWLDTDRPFLTELRGLLSW